MFCISKEEHDKYLEHYGIKGMRWGIRRTPEQLGHRKKYDPPYSKEQVIEKYGKKLADRLAKDPAHRFRMNTGIELIHQEPSKEELLRIYENWQLMTDEMKEKSDAMSKKLFGMTNEEHFETLIKTIYKN